VWPGAANRSDPHSDNQMPGAWVAALAPGI